MELTKREKDILERLANGLTSTMIGENLGISYRTVEFYTKILKTKFGAQNTPHLIALAFRSKTLD